MKISALVAAAVLLGIALPGTADAAGCSRSASVNMSCSIDGSMLTVTLDATEKKCGPPSAVSTADRVRIFVDQRRAEWDYTGVSADQSDVPLQAVYQLDLCNRISSDASAIRARGAVDLSGGQNNASGLFWGSCGRMPVPSC